MTDREFEAIRAVVNAMREDFPTAAKILSRMKRLGFSAEETEKAVNYIASRHE